jgi:4'-phosphopantetheinyl transferase
VTDTGEPESAGPGGVGTRGGTGHPSCSVWWATPREDPALADLLDDVERRRAARLARTADRWRYVTAHALVRLLLAARTGVPAAELRFERTCRRCGSTHHGKPRLANDLAGEAGPVPFSLARAGDRLAVAVSDQPGLEVGVDVERVPDPGDAVLAAVPEVLTTTELATYRRLDGARRGHALAVWWARKEAVLKAVGHGLAVAPSTIAVTSPDEAPAVTRWSAPVVGGIGLAGGVRVSAVRDRAVHPRVSMHDLEAAHGYVGCVAAVGALSLGVAERDASPLLGPG